MRIRAHRLLWPLASRDLSALLRQPVPFFFISPPRAEAVLQKPTIPLLYDGEAPPFPRARRDAGGAAGRGAGGLGGALSVPVVLKPRAAAVPACCAKREVEVTGNKVGQC